MVVTQVSSALKHKGQSKGVSTAGEVRGIVIPGTVETVPSLGAKWWTALTISGLRSTGICNREVHSHSLYKTLQVCAILASYLCRFPPGKCSEVFTSLLLLFLFAILFFAN